MALTKMFRYFPMNIDLAMKRLSQKHDLEKYDMVVVDQALMESEILEKINAAAKKGIEVALYGALPEDTAEEVTILERPATQQDVFELLITCFWDKPREKTKV